MANKIDSNLTGLAMAEEASIGVLPVSPIWRALEPNSYEGFGGEITTIARDPIAVGRQRKKGVITDLEASGGFQTDLLPYLDRIMQSFMFADARQKMSTYTLENPPTVITITGITTGPNTLTAASGLDGFAVNQLVKISGATTAANNIMVTVTTAAAATLTVSETLVPETPTAACVAEVCGYEFPESDLDINVTGEVVTLTSAAIDMSTLGVIVGEWIYLGGDAADNTFVNNQGYARIASITATTWTLEETTWTPQTEAAGTFDIRVFFGTVIKNENTTALIVTKSLQFERQVGEDANGVQSEYITGAIANELSVNMTSADKATVDMSFIAADSETRDGTTGIKAGTRVTAPAQDAFNTSSDVVRNRIYIVDATLNPTALFAYASEVTLTINNNAEGLKAIGTLGNFDVNVGTFEVGGSVTAYFTTVAAVAAIRANSDVAYNLIVAKNSKAVIFDIPLLSLGDGAITIEKDSPVTIPLETFGAENTNGYTLLINFFPHLPAAAMP